MFGSLGAPELVLIALVVVLLFGVGKFSNLGRDLGSSIKEFRRAVKDDEEKAAEAPQIQQATQYAPPPPPAQQPPQQQYTPPAAPPQSPPQQGSESNKPNVF